MKKLFTGLILSLSFSIYVNANKNDLSYLSLCEEIANDYAYYVYTYLGYSLEEAEAVYGETVYECENEWDF